MAACASRCLHLAGLIRLSTLFTARRLINVAQIDGTSAVRHVYLAPSKLLTPLPAFNSRI